MVNDNLQLINIVWKGPFTLPEVRTMYQSPKDVGVYQVYGSHPLYGDGVLLYIGKTIEQTFGARINQEGWDKNRDSNTIQVYLGCFGSYDSPHVTKEELQWQITAAERLLIYAHGPACNSSGLNVVFDKEYHNVHVLNWQKRRALYPEVSGQFYSNLYKNKTYHDFTPESST